jgi:hypothetical protein
MNQEQRFQLIMDDLRAIKQHLYLNNLGHLLEQPTTHCDELHTHFNNIEIACDLKSDEADTWKKFENDDDDTKYCDITGETMTEGWVANDGETYFKESIEDAYDNEVIYWTEWED